jgi:hypothetical protein
MAESNECSSLERLPFRITSFLLHLVPCCKDFWSLDSTPSVVENVLGQLTESRGTNEDRRWIHPVR